MKSVMKIDCKFTIRANSNPQYILRIAKIGVLSIIVFIAYGFYLFYVKSFFRDNIDNFISVLIATSSIFPVVLNAILNTVCLKFNHKRVSIVVISYFRVMANALFILWMLLCLYWSGYLFAKGNPLNWENKNISYFFIFTMMSILLTIYPLVPNLFMRHPLDSKKDKSLVKQTCIDINRFVIFSFYFVYVCFSVNIGDVDSVIVQSFTVYIGFDRLHSIIKSNKKVYHQEFIRLYRQISYKCVR